MTNIMMRDQRRNLIWLFVLVIMVLVITQLHHGGNWWKQRQVHRTAIAFGVAADTITATRTDNNNTTTTTQQQHETRALVMRTMAPLHPLVLERIYELALLMGKQKEEDSSSSSTTTMYYDFWILVDETKNSQTEQLLDMYFRKRRHQHGRQNDTQNDMITVVQPPRIFPVSEAILFHHYPNLTNYFYNEPEPNFNNEPGLCCGKTILWQTFIPTIAIFMKEHQTNYKFVWSFEDDVTTHGQYSIYDIVRIFDEELELLGGSRTTATARTTSMDQDQDQHHPPPPPHFDLVAVELGDSWGKKIHTMAMERILEDMRNSSVPWRRYSDAIQRHSQELDQSVYMEIKNNNVMQFGESLIHPIVWKHNHTVIDLKSLVAAAEGVADSTTIKKINAEVGSIFGLRDLTGKKLDKAAGIIGLLKSTPNKNDKTKKKNKYKYKYKQSTTSHKTTTTRPATFIFHEKIPQSTWDESILSQILG